MSMFKLICYPVSMKAPEGAIAIKKSRKYVPARSGDVTLLSTDPVEVAIEGTLPGVLKIPPPSKWPRSSPFS